MTEKLTYFGSEEERLECLSLRIHPFIINLTRYESVEDFVKSIKVNQPRNNNPVYVNWMGRQIAVGSYLYKKLVERAITAMFLQNFPCMLALLESTPQEIRFYLEKKESGSDLLPAYLVEDVLFRIRNRNK